jgi:uncharacterized protein YegP (UPF0339 family)
MMQESTRQTGAPDTGQLSADRHFLEQTGHGFPSNDQAGGRVILSEIGEAHQGHFAIFRVQSTSLTSTQFAGGDWRWRLIDPDGAILVEAGGYRSEAHCREAVAILQARAARATVA